MRVPRTARQVPASAPLRRCMQCEARKHRICTLPGDGIGPEIMKVATDLLAAAGAREDVQFELSEHLIGGAAIDAAAVPYPEATQSACKYSDAVLLAAIGGCVRLVPHVPADCMHSIAWGRLCDMACCLFDLSALQKSMAAVGACAVAWTAVCAGCWACIASCHATLVCVIHAT